MRSRDEIEKILAAELAAAQKRNTVAGEVFREVINDIPSGIPAPDGAFRIQLAGAEHREAIEGLDRALKRFSGFIVNGIIPDDLIKSA